MITLGAVFWGFGEEATGVLHHVITSEGSLVAEIGPVNVLLPPELEDELEPLVGERIGLLKTGPSKALSSATGEVSPVRGVRSRRV